MTVDVLETEAVATLLRCAPTTVRDRARAGDLPGIKFGDDWVFPAEALHMRLTELALEQAATRRKPAKPSAQLHTVPRKAKRTPPTLPTTGG